VIAKEQWAALARILAPRSQTSLAAVKLARTADQLLYAKPSRESLHTAPDSASPNIGHSILLVVRHGRLVLFACTASIGVPATSQSPNVSTSIAP
jgi:hypothetical protein